MKKTTTKKVKQSEESRSNFSVTITMGTDVYKGEGETALAALSVIPKPVKIMAKGVVRITDGEKVKEVLMYPLRLRRLFYNKLFQEIQLKSLCMGMK